MKNPRFIETALDSYREKRSISNERNSSASAVSLCISIEDMTCYPVGCPSLQYPGFHEDTACYPVGCQIQYTGFYEERSSWSALIAFLLQRVFVNRNRWINSCSEQDLSDVSYWRLKYEVGLLTTRLCPELCFRFQASEMLTHDLRKDGVRM